MPSFASLSQSAKNGLSKSIFYVKNHPNLSQFFLLKNTNLEAHFLLLAFFNKINFLTTLLLKLGQIFDEVAKLGKSTQEAYNPRKWLILSALLKNWVAEDIASNVNDFILHGLPSQIKSIKNQKVFCSIFLRSLPCMISSRFVWFCCNYKTLDKHLAKNPVETVKKISM